MSKQLIVIIGNGGHSKVVQDIIMATGEYQVKAILDDSLLEKREEGGVLYAAIESAFQLVEQHHPKFVIAIGNNSARQKIARHLADIGAEFAPPLIHPTAVVSPSAKMGGGTVVMANAVINAEAAIGEHVIINTAAIVEHDNQIDSFAHISPNTTLAGTVHIGLGVHVGAGATVIPGKSIGNWSVIGANATVVSDIRERVTAVGTPAKIIERKEG